MLWVAKVGAVVWCSGRNNADVVDLGWECRVPGIAKVASKLRQEQLPASVDLRANFY